MHTHLTIYFHSKILKKQIPYNKKTLSPSGVYSVSLFEKNIHECQIIRLIIYSLYAFTSQTSIAIYPSSYSQHYNDEL